MADSSEDEIAEEIAATTVAEVVAARIEVKLCTLVAPAGAGGARKRRIVREGEEIEDEDVVSLGQVNAAIAEGGAEGTAALENHLKASTRRTFLTCGAQVDMASRQEAAAAGAAAGVSTAIRIPSPAGASDQVLDSDDCLSAARAGAQAESKVGRGMPVAPVAPSSRYTTLLGPLVGGSLPASVTLYSLLRTSSVRIECHTKLGATDGNEIQHI
ncbi:hypothetical protein BRADI_1g56706v3 [Brachypodium distachyon]|uniref:Uncharacterized protein n=1 Tax=Brachypodium distachyon TaxID=15368 RepID=A0A2K2DRU7_BRADI|nr:hypothetical protein BRADI_1g56706v3 [Brachypodium distachyon]